MVAWRHCVCSMTCAGIGVGQSFHFRTVPSDPSYCQMQHDRLEQPGAAAWEPEGAAGIPRVCAALPSPRQALEQFAVHVGLPTLACCA
jgi:hypothetical protein